MSGYRYLLLLIVSFQCYASLFFKHLSSNQVHAIGMAIWYNESNQRVQGLTHWNSGEPCASCGIGHFLWYPAGVGSKSYTETFPALINFFKEHDIQLPQWLQPNTSCPWPNKASFDAACNSITMQELRNLLKHTIQLQTDFIIEQTEKRLAQLLNTACETERPILHKKISALTQTTGGCFAIIDYINFKGDGTNIHEQYQTSGWGLLQVLQQMSSECKNPLYNFVQSARQILARRVSLAPPEKHENRWLNGWHNRLSRYQSAFAN